MKGCACVTTGHSMTKTTKSSTRIDSTALSSGFDHDMKGETLKEEENEHTAEDEFEELSRSKPSYTPENK